MTSSRGGFFFWMSVLLLGLVLIAFAPTFFLRPFSSQSPLPTRLVVHGAVLTGWFVWLVVQTSAIRTGRIATHRRLGVFGVGIGVACIVGSPLATAGAVRSLRAAGLDWDTDMSAYPVLGIEGWPMEVYAAQLVFGNIGSIIAFAALLFAAFLLRRFASYHKRLMMLASISLVGPALARLSRWPGLGGEDGVFIPLALLALLLMLAAHDFVTMRRVHKATLTGGLATVLIPGAMMIVALTPIGSGVLRAME